MFDSHQDDGSDYDTLPLLDLFTLKPTRQPKGAGPAILASTYHDFDARNHAKQRENGQFVILAADIDSGDHSMKAVQDAVRTFAPGIACLIYSSAHARPGDMRWRVLFPLAQPVSFDAWHDAQTALFAFLASRGIECDHALARAAQPIYLPNVPDVHGKSGTALRGEDGKALFYTVARTKTDKPGLDLTTGVVSEGIAAIVQRRLADQQERERIRREAESRRASMPRGDQASLIDDFNAANSVAAMLELCGYEQCPRNAEDWRSPYQTSETYATRVIGSKWVSLSASDASANIGTHCKSGCYGDAYDLFVHFKHGGDNKAAFRQLGAERRASNVVYPDAFQTPPVPDYMLEAPMPDEAPEWLEAEPVFDEPDMMPVDAADTFQILDLDELENLPSPEWLVKELVVDDGLTVIFGDPGAGKSFVALDMALRLSLGMDWHGTETKQVGVLYIAGEGARGLGKRVKGWRREHGKQGAAAPFMLLPVPVALLDPEQRAKLLRTIDEAIRRAGFAIGLVVIDTVSRSLAGAGENGADEMGAFVSACDIVRHHIGGAVLGVHHSGKDKEKGMRGSTVLLGACDGVIRVTKDGELVTLKTEKQKDAEESAPIYMRMKKVSWPVEGDEWQSTLVPFLTADRPVAREEMSTEQVGKAFELLAKAWSDGKPLSNAPQVRNQGRYAPSVLSGALQCSEKLISEYITSWLENDCLRIEELDSHSKTKGLRVISSIIPGGAK
jgi:hypothetical protein